MFVNSIFRNPEFSRIVCSDGSEVADTTKIICGVKTSKEINAKAIRFVPVFLVICFLFSELSLFFPVKAIREI